MRLLGRFPALHVSLAAVGLTSTIGQLVLMRELTAVFYGNELVLGLILAAWLVWVALGAWGFGYLAPLRSPSEVGSPQDEASREGRMATGLAITIALLPIQVSAIRGSRVLLGVTPGALVPLWQMALVILLTLAPLCVLLGRLFTLGARAVSAGGGSAGSAYVAESLGAVVGGVVFSFGLVRWLLPFQVVLGVGALNLVVAAQLARRRWWLGGAGAATLALGALFLGARIERATLGWQYDGLRFARDSVYGRIVVVGRGEQRIFFESGLLFFETQGVAAKESVHLPLLSHPEPRQILLIGGGVSGSLGEVLGHPSVQAVHYVELDPLIISAARVELPPDQALALDDPRVTLVHVDGRIYVHQAAWGKERFDVIVLDLPEPATGQLNRFYTQEFFVQVKQILAPGGVFALSLPWQENYPGPALQRLGTSVYHTLGAEFSEIVLLPGDRLFLLASDLPLASDPAILSARLAERGVKTRWMVPSYLDYLYTNDRVAQARALVEAPGAVRPNRDLEPICYFYDLIIWLSRFQGAGGWGTVRREWVLGGAVVVLLAAVPLLRRCAVPAVLGFIGLSEMTLQVVTLFAFQVVHGYVYRQVGVIVTASMAGLSAGGAIASRWRWPAARASAYRAFRCWSPARSPRLALAWLQGAIVLSALVFSWLVGLSPAAWVFPLLALAVGGVTGLAFPVALECMQAQEGRAIGMLYGADLVGGCVGSAMASVMLVPILGIPQTCLVVAIVGAAGLLILL